MTAAGSWPRQTTGASQEAVCSPTCGGEWRAAWRDPSAPAHDRALLVERGLSGLTVRQVSTFVGAPVPLLASVPLDVLPRPQLKPTVAAQKQLQGKRALPSCPWPPEFLAVVGAKNEAGARRLPRHARQRAPRPRRLRIEAAQGRRRPGRAAPEEQADAPHERHSRPAVGARDRADRARGERRRCRRERHHRLDARGGAERRGLHEGAAGPQRQPDAASRSASTRGASRPRPRRARTEPTACSGLVWR